MISLETKRNLKSDNWMPPDWIATDCVHLNKNLRYTLTGDVMDLVSKVADHSSIRRNYDLMEEAFSCLLANLVHADALDKPLVYTRDSNAYKIERKRYGYEWYRYRMVIRLVDAMYDLGLIGGVKGKKYPNGKNKPSKMWASEELLSLLAETNGPVFIKKNDEVVFLKDGDKTPIDYKDNRFTKQMRDQIHRFNEMLGSLNITFEIDYQTLSDRPKPRVTKMNKIRSMYKTSQIKIVSNRSILLPDNRERVRYRRVRNKKHKRDTTIYYNHYDHDAYLSNKFSEIVFVGTVNSEANRMRRIFNIDWEHGGRFYHAPHITLPSACRKTMLINGEPTVELDYSGLHIRMLYNEIGIDYRGECYVYGKADKSNKADRDRIKLASLIVINSDDRKKAIAAVHDQCRKKDIHYPAGEFHRYADLVDRFETYHEPIKAFLLSGKGLELQNKDSMIMAAILDRLAHRNIPALPVHDKVICPAQHEDFLRQVMMEEYEKKMDFEPIID